MVTDDLTQFAATIAPEIDRVRLALVGAAGPRLGEMITTFSLTPESAMVASMLRNLRPSRTVAVADLAELYVYQREGYTEEAVDALRAAGLVQGDDVIGLTAEGADAIGKVMSALEATAAALWPDPPDLTSAIAAAQHALDDASRTGGVTFQVVAPVHVYPEMPPVTLFTEMLTPLRFHRFDAHVAAWRAARLSPAELDALEEPARAEIERDTNERAAAAYAGLDASERADLLAGLRSLVTT